MMHAHYIASVAPLSEPGSPERKHPRRSAHVELRGVSVQDGFTATTHDVSEDGMAFESDLKFARGDRIQIVLPIPHSHQSLRILCEVKHSHAFGITGVEFVQLSKTDRGRVLEMTAAPERYTQSKTGT